MTKNYSYDDLVNLTKVRPGKKISLKKDFDPGFTPDRMSKKEAANLLKDGVKKVAEFQDKLYAQDTYSLLLIFQAMDAAGKDGTIKHVMSGINPQGCSVFSFKAPSAEELDHDYLWRCHVRMPARGHIGIFNRSYYEEVLVVRVHPEILERQQLPPEFMDKKIWERRYRQINDYEQYMAENGTRIVKFFLNVSKQEQKWRFLDRIKEPEKNWKFSARDVAEREHWDRYQSAYQDLLNATSTECAPWFVIPADNKWFTRMAVARIVYHTMMDLNPEYPVLSLEAQQALAAARVGLEAE